MSVHLDDSKANAMVGLPAYCARCDAIFFSRQMDFNNMIVDVQDMELTCDNCGSHRARVIDGIFNITGGVVEILSAPGITEKMLLALHEIASGAYTSNEAVEITQEKAKKIHPTFAGVFNAVQNKKISNRPLLLILLALLSFCAQAQNINWNINLDVNKLIDQLSEGPPAQILEPPQPKNKP